MALVVAYANAMYSDSVEERATNCCFLLPQHITPFANNKQYLEVERRVSLQPAQSASE